MMHGASHKRKEKEEGFLGMWDDSSGKFRSQGKGGEILNISQIQGKMTRKGGQEYRRKVLYVMYQ